MITEELKQLVREEAEKLLALSTQMERNALDFSSFDPCNAAHCVYGQMAGHCRSNRAMELLEACAKPYMIDIEGDLCDDGAVFHQGLLVNYSPIESYIMLPGAKNANLLAYLKGETDTLEL